MPSKNKKYKQTYINAHSSNGTYLVRKPSKVKVVQKKKYIAPKREQLKINWRPSNGYGSLIDSYGRRLTRAKRRALYRHRRR